jgi:hypothetical protein
MNETKYTMSRFWDYVWKWARKEAPLLDTVTSSEVQRAGEEMEMCYIEYIKNPSLVTCGAWVEAQRRWMLSYARWIYQGRTER